jgi:mRNA-degrading endonuclease RelE of RelBE toxin-antitoxin system
MRRPESLHTYSVEVSPSAWKQMAHLPLDTYQRVRQELERIAVQLRTPTPAPLPKKEAEPFITRSLSLEGHIVLYEIDTVRRRLTLRELVPSRG